MHFDIQLMETRNSYICLVVWAVIKMSFVSPGKGHSARSRYVLTRLTHKRK